MKIVLKDAVGGDPTTEVAIRYGLFLNAIIAFIVDRVRRLADLEDVHQGGGAGRVEDLPVLQGSERGRRDQVPGLRQRDLRSAIAGRTMPLWNVRCRVPESVTRTGPVDGAISVASRCKGPRCHHDSGGRRVMATVTFDHVWKRFGDFAAVKDLSLEIQDGEFMVLVGPSGCGKTTSLRMIAGLEEVTEGDLKIGDRVVNDVAPKDRDIAMVFQSYALYPHMSIYDNMAFGLKLRKVPKAQIDERVKEAARILNLENLQKKPRELSGGQRQRVALGRAIVREPAVFLMDEPLSNLDAKLRVQTRAEIARLHQRLGTTTVYVTHDQVEAMTMGTRIAVMDKGELQQVGTPQDLYDNPTQAVRRRASSAARR